jgi:hypothetical protein
VTTVLLDPSRNCVAVDVGWYKVLDANGQALVYSRRDIGPSLHFSNSFDVHVALNVDAPIGIGRETSKPV